jgi:GNAT superfamily N-acetyltransferase
VIRIEPSADVEAALALERAMGWPRSRAEVARRFAVAEGFLALDHEGAPAGSATIAIYRGVDDAPGFAWVGGMAVLPERRGQGVARRLLEACLARADEARVASVGLDATELGRPLYEKMGFRAVGRTPKWARDAREAKAHPSGKHTVHPISLSEAMEIAAFDAPRFGAKRLPWLLATLHDEPWRAFMSRDRRTGDVTGFALGQERAIGPVVADDEEAAAALVSACELAGSPPVIVPLDASPRALATLSALGYAEERAGCLRMLRGADLTMRTESIVGIGAWALG